MPVTKKPIIEKADEFIGGAKAAADVKPQEQDSGKPVKRETANAVKRESVKADKKTKMTFYMSPEMYLKWKEYEFKQLQDGKKVSFQGVVEKYLNKLL
jgi:hypothetical protein